MIKTSIRRPVAVTMAYLAVALLGVAAWRNIPVELLPERDLPKLTVRAYWRGASAEVAEAFLTSPLEGEIQQVKGVEKISSNTTERNGVASAVISAEFARETDMDFVRLELSERLAVLEENLPEAVYGLQVEPYIPDEFERQNVQFLRYTVTGPYTLEALRAHVDDVIKPEILQVEGVAEVEVMGGRDRLVEIELDDEKMRSLGVDLATVRRRINELEYVSEAGQVQRRGILRTLAIRQRAASVQDIEQVPVVTDRGRIVRLREIAVIHDTYEQPFSYYRIDGMPAVAFMVIKENATNTIKVADAVKDRIAGIDDMNPPGVRVILDADESKEIRRQLSDLKERAIISAIVIFAVLLLFLQSFRSAAIIFATIGFSILIALNLIYFAGNTLNVLTLMGLAMGFGLIVDNAIVVLENIFRRWRSGDDPARAAKEGAQGVVLPILAATLTTLIVFIPFVYLQGELRVYYVPLALVVGMSLLASLFVAFTFIPALASKVLTGSHRRGEGEGEGSNATLPQRRPVYERFYAGLLGFTTRFPWVTIVLALSLFGGSYYLFDKYVNRGILWGGFFGQDTRILISIRQPRGAELERTDELTRFFENRLRTMPEIKEFVTRVSPEAAQINITFPGDIENTQIPVAIKEQLVAYSHSFGGADVRVYGYGPSFYGGGAGPPNYSIKILGYNYEKVRDIARDLQRRLERFSRVRDVDINAAPFSFFGGGEKAVEYAVKLNREQLALHGLTARNVVAQINAAVGGQTSRSPFRVAGEEVDYELKLRGYSEFSVSDLRDLLLQVPGEGEGVRLDEVAHIEEREILNLIKREDQQYQRLVRYEFRGPTKLGDRVRDAVINTVDLPEGYRITASDEWRWDIGEQKQIYGVLAVSLVLVFMVTAALFESLKQPLVVLFTVPMALIGVFLMFFYTEANFTREAYVGVIMMGGIVVNNAILLVDHVNQKRRLQGMALKEALIDGTLERVRPILMTSATTILGLLPLVIFSDNVDSNIWNALGYALIGGLASSTVLVLTVTPAVYLLFERRAERVHAGGEALATGTTGAA